MGIQRGLKVPSQEYSIPILEAIYELTEGSGGQRTIWGTIERSESARLEDIIQRVGIKMKGLLTEIDYKPIKSGSIRWDKTARWEINRLFEAGLIERHAEGRYRLSKTGKTHIQKDS